MDRVAASPKVFVAKALFFPEAMTGSNGTEYDTRLGKIPAYVSECVGI
jgi:hypothetical protein